MNQLIICMNCPYYNSKCKDETPYCNKTLKRCKELGEYKNYIDKYKKLINNM